MRSRCATRLITPNRPANTSMAKIGRYWPMGSGSLRCLGGLEVVLEGLVSVVQHQNEEDEQRERDHEVEERNHPFVTQVAHEHDRHDRRVRIDLGQRWGLA